MLFFAFPLLYASSFSGFYLALNIVLWLLIFRALGIELRGHLANPLWRAFFDACGDDPVIEEVRVMLDLLLHDAEGVPPTEVEMLNGLDSIVRSSLISGPFIWEPELQGGFPQDRYWYLYGHLKKSKE